MDPAVARVAPASQSLAWPVAPDAVADVCRALGRPCTLDEDLAACVGKDDAALVPDRVDGLPGPLFADLEPDPVQADVAERLDLHIPAALATLRENASRCSDLSIGDLRAAAARRGGVASQDC